MSSRASPTSSSASLMSSRASPTSSSASQTSSSASPTSSSASQTSSSASPTSSRATQTSTSASPTSPNTGSPTPSPQEGSGSKNKTKPNTAAIAGGVIGSLVGSVIAITLAGVAIFFFLRRSSQAQPAVSLVEQPITRIYVRAFVPCVALVSPHMPHSSQICTPRTRMTQLRFRGTKVVRTCGASLLKYPCHRTLDLETLNPTRRSCFPRLGDTIRATLLPEQPDLSLWIFHRCLGLLELLFLVFPPSDSFFFCCCSRR